MSTITDQNKCYAGSRETLMEIAIGEEKKGEAGKTPMLDWAAGGILNRTRKIQPMPVLFSHTP